MRWLRPDRSIGRSSARRGEHCAGSIPAASTRDRSPAPLARSHDDFGRIAFSPECAVEPRRAKPAAAAISPSPTLPQPDRPGVGRVPRERSDKQEGAKSAPAELPDPLLWTSRHTICAKDVAGEANPRVRPRRSHDPAATWSAPARPRRIPQEVDEQADEWDDEDNDEPEQLAGESEIVAADDAYGDERPDEDPRDERRGDKPRTKGVRKRRHVGRKPTLQRPPVEIFCGPDSRRLHSFAPRTVSSAGVLVLSCDNDYGGAQSVGHRRPTLPKGRAE
jgi:hypothetical protein